MNILGGCAERLLFVRTAPPGATVTVNGAPVETTIEGVTRPALTPVEIPFDFYGKYEIVVRAPGHESQSRIVDVEAPFHAYPPLDFLVEHLVPWRVRDVHEIDFDLEPTTEADDDGISRLLERMAAFEKRLVETEK